MKKGEKQKAFDLRKQGYSFREIAEILYISKSTAALWAGHIEINKKGITRLQSLSEKGRENAFRTRSNKKNKLLLVISERAESVVNENFKLSLGYQKILCALLYWCEGEKSDNSVRFVNSDPELIRVFLHLLRNGFAIEESRFRICLHLHSYHNADEQIEFWAGVAGIPKSQFTKCYIKPNTGKRKKMNYPGCVSVRYNDSSLAFELKMLYTFFAHKHGRVV